MMAGGRAPDGQESPVPGTLVQPQVDLLAALPAQLREWLPPPVGVCACRAGTDDFPIAADDLQALAKAVPRRRAEFTGGRWCAHRALEQIGRPAGRLPVGEFGGPTWPAGVVGSITHESDVCLAVASPSFPLTGVGIDLFALERSSDLDSLADLFLAPGDTLPDQAAGRRFGLAVAFSAKEAIVKAASPLVRRFIDPRRIKLSIAGHCFQAEVEGCVQTRGRWKVLGRFLLALAIVEGENCRRQISCPAAFSGVRQDGYPAR